MSQKFSDIPSSVGAEQVLVVDKTAAGDACRHVHGLVTTGNLLLCAVLSLRASHLYARRSFFKVGLIETVDPELV